jgi:alpha-N-arabinofuranosidase
MLDFKNLGLSRGVFAPTIEHHDGVFYVANTCVDCGGNFIVTAMDPAGPWSDPVWLPEIGGIDPSLFFDGGKVYLMNNDAPPKEALYDGHRAIWIREIDPQTFQSITEPVVLIDGGVRPEEKPIWIEGPHIYKVGEQYYLSAAEGGTAENHSQVVLRARSVLGPYEPYEGNPILTQRDLAEDRADPVTSVGHADLVTDDDGNWWATFLGVRPYEGDYYNTGRETFLAPVEWKDGWPIIGTPGAPIPYVGARPASPVVEPPAVPVTGNFSIREEFDAPLTSYWLTVRDPGDAWIAQEGGAIALHPQADGLGDFGRPAMVARRQQHLNAAASTAVSFAPNGPGVEAGLAAFQNDEYYYALGVAAGEEDARIVRLRKRAGPDDPADGVEIASAVLDGDADAPVYLRIRAGGAAYGFDYATSPGEWRALLDGADGRILSTRTAGGFVGAVFGMYAVKGVEAP